ncbi:hypothetical protein D6T65_17260 [Arthrobacter frigidicola]|nr:hypothetical protein D6T65_17260 [Arthrobacter frigidicola]
MGLLTEFPAVWYVALACVLGVAIWGVCARCVYPSPLMAASTGGLVVILYSSASLLAEVPRLPWTYKHIAVTDFIVANGRVDPSIDIYNRWPGFFSGSAFLGEMTGYHNALAYAASAETAFALVNLVLMLAIVRALSDNSRVQWTATLVFVLSNWVNQNYYSPQAFAFTLYLTVCLACFTYLRGTPVTWVAWVEEKLRLLSRGSAPEAHHSPQQPAGPRVITVILAVYAVLVVSHQLSPYLAMLGLVPLFVFGYFRPRLLSLAFVVITLLYLIPNFEFIEEKYGIFSGIDVVSNSSNTPEVQPATDRARLVAYAAPVLSLITGGLAAAGYVKHMLRGQVRITLMVAWLSFAPLLGLLGQSYGGEARFRVYLFALPWLAIGVAWLFWSGPRSRRAMVGAAASLTAMAALFTAAYFYMEATYRVIKEDVVAGQWLDARVREEDLVFETNFFFPLLIGPNYPGYLEWGKNTPLAEIIFDSPDVWAKDVEALADTVRDTDTIYVVFSDTQKRHAVNQYGPKDAQRLFGLERELATAQNAENVFDNGAVRIYRISASP